MRTLRWKWLVVIITILAALIQLSYTWRFYRLKPDELKNIAPEKLKTLQSRSLRLGLDLKGGMHMVMEVDKSHLKPEEVKGATDRALEVIRNRVDQFGVSEPVIQKQGKDRIVVQLPGVVNRERAREIIGKTALLEFKLVADDKTFQDVLKNIEDALKKVNGDTFSLFSYFMPVQGENGVPNDMVPEVKNLLASDSAKKYIPSGYQFLWGKKEIKEGYAYSPIYLVKSEALLTGEAILDAVPGVGTSDNPFGVKVDLTMTRKARGKWAMVTGANVGRKIAIVLDNTVQSAPVVRERIPSGRSEITLGNTSMEDAKALAVILKAGALPAPLKIIEERSVGPTLGRDSIREGAKSILIGAILVFLFMAIYYTKAGIVADIALFLNLLFVLAVLAGFKATLTLPGLAGLVLTVGMAVDANVLIYERLREEMRSGKTIRTAIANAYNRVFITIFDANLTTFVAAIILYWFGTGPIKGFAVTLSIGLIASFYTAIFLTRVVFESWSLKGLRNIKMFQIFKNPRFNFVGNRAKAFTLSGVIIFIGLISLVAHKGVRYGIDFTGGYLVEMKFDKSINAESLRKWFAEMNYPNAQIQTYIHTNTFLVKLKTTEAGTGDKIKKLFNKSHPENSAKVIREELVGPSISKGLQLRAIWVVLLGMIAILIYVSIRFTYRFGVGAVVALLHDVLITVGILSIMNKEFTIPIIAAILTIIGYSINDSIVVSDRIRENIKLLRKLKFNELVNKSINDTLGRTIITSFTTLFVVLVLFLIGGRIIHDFSLALIIGVITGTYSSIFVVAPIVVAWEKRNPSRRKV